jgi:hypothetical protein
MYLLNSVMKFFKNLFDNKPEQENKAAPENTRLIFLINNWSQHRSNENYKLVVEELLNGNSYLILPSLNSGDPTITGQDWRTTEKDTKLQLTSVHNLDGLKVLGAFTDEKALLAWTQQKATTYTALKAKAALELCEDSSINTIVINSGSPNMFVVQRDSYAETIDIPDGTTIQIGAPVRPLNEGIIKNLILNFKSIGNILDAYQYTLSQGNEVNIVIGLKLLSNSENAKKAAIFAVQNALVDETSKTFVDIFFLETEEWFDIVKNVEDALFYKKP